MAADETEEAAARPLIAEAEPVTPVAEEVRLTPVAALPEGLATVAGLEPVSDEQARSAGSRSFAAPLPEADTPMDEDGASSAQEEAEELTDTVDETEGSALSVEPDVIDDAAAADATSLPDGTVVVTASTRVAGDVAVAGVTWETGETEAVVGVYLRSHVEDTWTDWEELEVTGTEDDLPVDSREGTEPMAVIEADLLEVAVVADRAVQAEVTVWDPGTSEADQLAALPDDGVSVDQTSTAGTAAATISTSAMTAAPVAQARSLASAPAIFTRADWGADESIRWGKVATSSIRGVVVHHTAGTNNYTAAQVPGIIRGIYSYHAVTRNWGDVGYNIMVDKFGRAWEGRYGSIQQSIWGAHAAPYNATMFGISVLGNHDLVPVTEAAMDTVARVTAWKFDQHGVPARGTTTIDGVTLNRVVGHRDVGQTSCPGRYFYPRLGELTDRIAAYQVDTGDRSLERDLTGDGVPDVVARRGGQVQILPGGRRASVIDAGVSGRGWNAARTIDPGDWNGDGVADLMLRDSSGKLWLYPGRSGGGWSPRVQVGHGWNNIDLIASGFDWDGDGRPDLLGRQSASGRLWLYPSDGRGGFRPSRQIGHGWSGMNLMTMVGPLWEGRPTLAARDTATGRLHMYAGDGAGGFTPGSTTLGRGWGNMRAVAAVGDRTGDGVPDVVALDRSGSLWQYTGARNGRLSSATRLTDSWADARTVLPIASGGAVAGVHTVNADGQLRRWRLGTRATLGDPLTTAVRLQSSDVDVTPIGDWDGDGRPDLAVRKANGDLMLHRGTSNGGFAASGTRIGNGWQPMEVIAGAGDWKGDGTPGILAYNGDMVWLYPGDGRGGFGSRIELKSGVDGYDALIPAGHWSGGRVPDVLMRGATSRALFLWPGNGPGSLLDRRQVGTGWGGMSQLVGVGDLDGDAKPDVLAVDDARRVWLYRGNGGGGFGTRLDLGTLPSGLSALS